MATKLPTVPQIASEATLEIFAHRSLPCNTERSPESVHIEYRRLVALGNKMLEAAYAHALFRKKPPLVASDLKTELEKLNQHVARWVKEYKWMEKIRRPEDVDLQTIQTPEEKRYMMEAYVGAVFVANGYHTLSHWIEILLQDFPADLKSDNDSDS